MGLTARMVFMTARWSCSGVTVDSIPGRGLYTPWWDNVVGHPARSWQSQAWQQVGWMGSQVLAGGGRNWGGGQSL